MTQPHPEPPEQTDWHRLFGMLLSDYFTDSPFVVETEKDLSLHQQLLDVVIVRKQPGTFDLQLPDGLDDLVNHNLITFKSFREALDAWALKELLGHYVNYRKQLSQRNQPLVPEEQFQLYAVCGRFPHNLGQQVALHQEREGVYNCTWGTDRIHVVVAAQLPQTERNAPLHLFSAQQAKVAFGASHYRPRSAKTSTLLRKLFVGYQVEGISMPITLDEYCQQLIDDERKQILASLTPDEVLKHVPPEELLKCLPPEQRVEGLSPEQRVEGLSTEELERLLHQRRATQDASK